MRSENGSEIFMEPVGMHSGKKLTCIVSIACILVFQYDALKLIHLNERKL